MKKIYAASLLGFLLFVGAMALLALRPNVVDFVTGSRRCELSRIEILNPIGRGHGVLTDPASLAFLASRARHPTLPAAVLLTNGVGLHLDLFDEWGSLGGLGVTITTNERIWAMEYYSRFGTEKHGFILLDPNAPEPLRRMVTFFLDKNNRGKDWSEADIKAGK